MYLEISESGANERNTRLTTPEVLRRASELGALLVATSIVLNHETGEVLFIERASPKGRGELALPGGKYDYDKDNFLLEAALRELREEIEILPNFIIAPRVLPFLFHTNLGDKQGLTYLTLATLAGAPSLALHINTEEVLSYKWLSSEQFPDRIFEPQNIIFQYWPFLSQTINLELLKPIEGLDKYRLNAFNIHLRNTERRYRYSLRRKLK